MTIKFIIPALVGLMIGLGLSQTTLPERALSQDAAAPAAKKPEVAKKPEATKKPEAAKTQPPSKTEAATKKPEAKSAEQAKSVTDLDLLQSSAKEFEKAFNAGDAKALGALFAEKAEVVDEDGNLVEGRANIEARFAESFKEFPKARTTVEIISLRQLSPDVAVEDGISTVTLEPEGPSSSSPYTLVHLKRDGKWLFASVRDFPAEAEKAAPDHLGQLAWLVGHWIDESRDGRVETTCKWSDDGHYLLQDYIVKPRRGGELRGSQRIGWDPLRRTVRSWVFDNSGGIVESDWTLIEGAWVVKVQGATVDGEAITATRILTPLTDDSYQIDSTNQIFAGELLPDSVVRVVRRPPAPKDQADAEKTE